MTQEVPKHLVGTQQHRNAKDLSDYLVHMTRSPDDLASIIAKGKIEARNPFGFAHKLTEPSATQNAVCFSEMPLSELNRLGSRGKLWGIAFRREFVLERGGHRIWYVERGGAPHKYLEGLRQSAVAAQEWDGPFWEMTPFIDIRDAKPGPTKYDFDWEREWRVAGDFTFELEDVAVVITLDSVGPTFTESIELGAPIYDVRDDAYTWVDGTTPSIGANMSVILEEFHATFATPDNLSLFRDPDGDSDDGYMWRGMRERFESRDALHEILPEAPEKITEAIAQHLDTISPSWGRWDEPN